MLRTFLLALAALLGACGAVAPRPSPTDSAFSVEFRRTGGFAGNDDRLVVAEDGRAHLATRRGACDLQVAPGEVESLRRELDGAGLASLPATAAPGAIADGFDYDVTYRGSTRHYPEDRVPPSLRPAVTRLSALVDRPCPR